MGNPTGFLLHPRKELSRNDIAARLKHYKEFDHAFAPRDVRVQAERCMDCGIPFCHGDTGCPVDNLIPEWNDLVYQGEFKQALQNLHSTNNFPEFTGRLCPAPCESACVLGINKQPVSIKGIERSIIDIGFENGWVVPHPPKQLNGKSVAVVGSGPAGLACAQELARFGFKVVVYEKNARIGGLLRFGIPDFKMEKWLIDRRIEQMEQEGVQFETGVNVGGDIPMRELLARFDYAVLAGGCEQPRDIPIAGRELKNIRFAMDFLTRQNDIIAGIGSDDPILADGKDVIVIGGGDTGSDCVGTANRQGARSVTQLELFPKPPGERADSTPWPYWPMKLRTSSSHEEGCARKWNIQTEAFQSDEHGNVANLKCAEVTFSNGKFTSKPNSEFKIKADLVLLAMGFVHPKKDRMLAELREQGLKLTANGQVASEYGTTANAHKTSVDRVFVCGDMRRGQSLIVWAIAEGRHCARQIKNLCASNTN